MARAFIGVGSNIGPEDNVRAAVRRLALRLRVRQVSTCYRSRRGRPEQPDFINAVVEVETDLDPVRLKGEVLAPIEEELGRVRTADRDAARTIDLDLLLYQGRPEQGVEMLDAQIAARGFLAVPLAELAPEMTLPGDGEEPAGDRSRIRGGGAGAAGVVHSGDQGEPGRWTMRE